MRGLLLLLMAVALVNCATAPTEQQMANADYGLAHTQEECTALAEQAIRSMLKDPASARFQHETCIKSYWTSVPVMGLPIVYGYVQTGLVNAKNSFGGYTGFSGYQTIIRNGHVVRRCLVDTDSGGCWPQ